MRSQINPVIAIVMIAVVLVGVGLYMWQKTAGRAPGTGKIGIQLDTSRFERDPAKALAELKALKDKEDAERGRH